MLFLTSNSGSQNDGDYYIDHHNMPFTTFTRKTANYLSITMKNLVFLHFSLSCLVMQDDDVCRP